MKETQRETKTDKGKKAKTNGHAIVKREMEIRVSLGRSKRPVGSTLALYPITQRFPHENGKQLVCL